MDEFIDILYDIFMGGYDSTYSAASCMDQSWGDALFACVPTLILTLGIWFALQFILPYEFLGPFTLLCFVVLTNQLLFNLCFMRITAIFFTTAVWTSFTWIYTFLQARKPNSQQPEPDPATLLAAQSVYTANTAAELDALLAVTTHAIVFFGAEWDLKSRDIAPLFAWLAYEYTCPRWFILIRSDISLAMDLHQRYEITELPTFIAFENGQPTPIQVRDPGPAAKVKRVDGQGIERVFGNLEQFTLMSMVKTMSDGAWQSANSNAGERAHAHPARVSFKPIDNARQTTQYGHRPNAPLRPGDRPRNGPVLRRRPGPQVPGASVNAKKLAPSRGGATSVTMDSAYYSSDDESAWGRS